MSVIETGQAVCSKQALTRNWDGVIEKWPARVKDGIRSLCHLYSKGFDCGGDSSRVQVEMRNVETGQVIHDGEFIRIAGEVVVRCEGICEGNENCHLINRRGR